jgi:hypothetical protein
MTLVARWNAEDDPNAKAMARCPEVTPMFIAGRKLDTMRTQTAIAEDAQIKAQSENALQQAGRFLQSINPPLR